MAALKPGAMNEVHVAQLRRLVLALEAECPTAAAGAQALAGCAGVDEP
jgi:hypothetical protein